MYFIVGGGRYGNTGRSIDTICCPSKHDATVAKSLPIGYCRLAHIAHELACFTRWDSTKDVTLMPHVKPLRHDDLLKHCIGLLEGVAEHKVKVIEKCGHSFPSSQS